MGDCATCLVRNQAICAVLEADELAVLNRIGRRQSVKRGQTVAWEGDESLLVANVVEGVLKLTTSTADGREQIVGVVYPSDFIGRPFGPTSQHSITALTDARLCMFTRSSFDGFAREHPRLEHKLLERTLTELDRARHWMLLLGRKSAEEKIATFLLEMSHRLAPAGCTAPSGALDLFELPFGRQQIADLLGLTIETVSRQMTRLTQSGVIAVPDRRAIRIVDRPAMETMAGNIWE